MNNKNRLAIKIVGYFIITLLLNNTPVSWAEPKAKDFLVTAVYLNDEDAVREHLSNEKTIQKELNPDCKTYQICRPIAVAALKSSIAIMALLIDAGAEIDLPNGTSGDTVLMITIIKNRRDMAKFLIERGADVNKPNRFGITPFWGAAAKGDIGLLKIMVKKGADMDWPGNIAELEKGQKKIINRVTPLMIAAKNGHQEAAGFLIRNGANINIRDSRGWSFSEYKECGNPLKGE